MPSQQAVRVSLTDPRTCTLRLGVEVGCQKTDDMLCFASVPRQQSRTPTENARRSRTGVNSESNESAVNYLRTVRSSKLNQAPRLLGEEPQRLAIRHSPDLSRMPCRASSRENAAGYCIQSTGIGRTTQESQRLFPGCSMLSGPTLWPTCHLCAACLSTFMCMSRCTANKCMSMNS